MSGDQLNLDAKVVRYSRIVCPTHGIPDCSALLNGCTVPAYLNRAGEDVRALVAEVRRLRAQVERVEDACREWIDGAESDRFERHVASQILAALDEPA